jgi:hypothetical protein
MIMDLLLTGYNSLLGIVLRRKTEGRYTIHLI